MHTGCPANQVLCGTQCIATDKCCKTNGDVGAKCTGGQICSADGGTCGEALAPQGMYWLIFTCRHLHVLMD